MSYFLGSTLCQDIDWCRIFNCIVLCPLHPFILILNCIHGPNPDGTAWLDVNCCYDNANECFRPRDLSSNSESHTESSPLISPVITYSWNNFLIAFLFLWLDFYYQCDLHLCLVDPLIVARKYTSKYFVICWYTLFNHISR